jgi:NAD(P)H-flavin reductase/ferredoxin
MSHTIQLEGHGIEFSCEPATSVLDGALAAGYEIPYSCRSGICGSCRGRVVSGKVQGGLGGGLTAEEEKSGHVLLCQAHPCSDVSVEVREVRKIDKNAIKTIKAKVYRMTRAAPDVTILQLRFPAGTRVKFKAGQYLSVKLEDGSFRHYSMANPPHQNDSVELHIRHVPGGRFSQRMEQGLAAGEQLELSIPYGDFFLRGNEDGSESGKPIVLLASGTGFAPIKSIIEDAIKAKSERSMVLYWGARRPQDLYKMNLARKWESQLSWFRFVPVLSDAQPSDDWTGRTGLVHQAVMADIPSLTITKSMPAALRR